MLACNMAIMTVIENQMNYDNSVLDADMANFNQI